MLEYIQTAIAFLIIIICVIIIVACNLKLRKEDKEDIDPLTCIYVADEYNQNGANFEKGSKLETIRDLMLSGI
jgi:large-conductance mechanosensitive channel